MPRHDLQSVPGMQCCFVRVFVFETEDLRTDQELEIQVHSDHGGWSPKFFFYDFNSWLEKKLVAEELDLASQNPGVSIASITAQRDVTAHFLQTFRPEKFFTVFYWMKKTIDYEWASPLGKYYMSSKSTLIFYFKYTNDKTLPIIDIFANLAGYVKLYLDSKSDDNRQMTKETILDFWDRMAEAKNYSQVDQMDFKKRTHWLLSKKKSQKSKTPVDECTFFSTDPPSKVAASSSPWSMLFPTTFCILFVGRSSRCLSAHPPPS